MLHVEQDLDYARGHEMWSFSWHLLKFHEILDASSKKLPRLQHIEIEQHSLDWDDYELGRIKATNKVGVLWLNANESYDKDMHDFVKL